MKNILNTCLLLLSSLAASAQSEQPTSAPKVNPFNLNSDNLGSIANSVNLFTGDLNLPLNLVSISGNGGLGIDLTINYSSANIENQVDVWNLEAPTGVLGLGWSLSYPMIVVDNKLTGARDDDEFYLVEGGVSTKLVCIGNNSGVKSYKTKTYTNWLITYVSSLEKWEIIREDGTRYVYGDQNSGRNTVQWIIKWDNWIGSSHEWTNQRQGLVWNLSEVKNIWGEMITYTYQAAENTVGEGTVTHTEASYLWKITDTWGREVELIYKSKLAQEFADPHTELAEPDAYQERYEKNYLDKIIVKSDEISFYEIHLDYVTSLLGTGSTTKRLLKMTTKVGSSGSQSPAMLFNYLPSGSMRGALSEVSTASGGSVSFEYHAGLPITNSVRNKADVTAPTGYQEPTVTIEGDDYIVVTWRQLDGGNHTDNPTLVNVSVYDWDGRWMEKQLGTIGSVRMDHHNQDFQIATGKDFFAIIRHIYSSSDYVLYLWHKDERKPGEWISSSYTINLGSRDLYVEPILFVGSNFVTATDRNGKIYRYVWNGNSWGSSVVTESTGLHFTSVANNYIISHNTAPNPDQITLYYLDETRIWQSSSTTNSFNNGANDSYWHAANAFALVMANGGNEFIYRWNENYTSFVKYDVGFQYPDATKILITGESQITFIQPSSYTDRKIRALRFDGDNWNDSGEGVFYSYAHCSAGIDLFLWEADGTIANGKSYVKEFDPNISEWKLPMEFERGDASNQAEIGIAQLWLYSTIYQRNNNGTWNEIGTLGADGSPEEDWDKKPMANAFPYGQVFFVKNGAMGISSENYSGTYYARNDLFLYDEGQFLLGPRTLVTSNCFQCFLSVSDLDLYRINNYKITGPILDYPVTKVVINDGTRSYHTAYSYDAAKAVFDQSGSVARYNKVSTYPGSSTPASKPFGYTETYFFNGLSEAEIGETFPQEAPNGNAPSNYQLLTGRQYRVRVFNSTSSTPVAETSTIWNVEYAELSNGTSSVDRAYVVRPFKIININDGIETQAHFQYNAKHQVSSRSVITKSGSTEHEVVHYMYTYVWQKYPAMCDAKNILAPIVQASKNIGPSSYTESTVSRWKEWACSGSDCQYSLVPAPVDEHSWKGTNTITFTWWDVATQTPSTDWLFAGKILARDSDCGAVIEEESEGNQLGCWLLNETKKTVLATSSNASLSKVAYSSFEDASTGNWSWSDGMITEGSSKTGDQYMKLGTGGLTKSGLNSSERYTITFWAKSNGGSLVIDGVGTVSLGSLSDWTLYQYTVSGISELNIRRNGATEVQIDEIRVYPEMAGMATQTFHPLFGMTSSTSANNQTTYLEYDDLGRVVNELDEGRNIVKAYHYNHKK